MDPDLLPDHYPPPHHGLPVRHDAAILASHTRRLGRHCVNPTDMLNATDTGGNKNVNEMMKKNIPIDIDDQDPLCMKIRRHDLLDSIVMGNVCKDIKVADQQVTLFIDCVMDVDLRMIALNTIGMIDLKLSFTALSSF